MRTKGTVCLLIILMAAGIFIGISFGGSAAAYADTGNTVYLGGIPLGITVGTDGVYVGEYVEIATDKGGVCPAKLAGLHRGDMIVGMNGNLIKCPKDIILSMKEVKDGNPITLQVKTDETLREVKIIPVKDPSVNEYKLGFMTKSDLAGIGTLTYIKGGSYRFGSLGHRIYDPADEAIMYKEGSVFNANINGCNKGTPTAVGGLRGSFSKASERIGKVDKNTIYGIFGFMNKELTKDMISVGLGSKDEIKLGEAFVYTTVKGNKPEKYSIEIVRTMRQNTPSEKGMVIRIVDGRLLESTGGIVQGMSGSPIVQNGKIIGAVSHVFSNDPTMGYGMYIDWMINN